MCLCTHILPAWMSSEPTMWLRTLETTMHLCQWTLQNVSLVLDSDLPHYFSSESFAQERMTIGRLLAPRSKRPFAPPQDDNFQSFVLI